MLVADALRLGGAILGSHPDMLAPQLIGRLLPEIGGNVNVKMLLRACDNDGAKNCALLPVYHCLHTPGSEHQRHDQRRKSRYRRNYATFSFEP